MYLFFLAFLIPLMPLCAAEPIVVDAKSKIVYSAEEGKFSSFAAKELQDILEKTIRVRLPMISSEHPEARKATNRILVGRSGIVRELLGAKTIARLQNEESLVTGRGGDLILVGGGELGTQYAVFDFLENSAGYRMFADYPGMERFVPVKKIQWNGIETRNRPAFTGYRLSYGLDLRRPLLSKFMYRNRNNGQFKFNVRSPWFDPEYRPCYFRVMGGQHGLLLFIPPYDLDLTGFLGVKWEGMFQKHPEYFSMDQFGKRNAKAQLCFSSPDCRKLLQERFRKIVSKNGKGIYMIGSNDSHNSRYCYCDGCGKLIEKYGTNGGPLWDFLVELCRDIKDDLPGVFITSLAYKGPEQTEKAPEHLKFPENFICDAAFLNSDRSLAEIPTSADGFNRLENLKKWCKISPHVSYWYYGGATPVTWYGRMQKEIKELHSAGVRSVGSCGYGGGVEFIDIAQYLYFKLLQNPNLDEKKLIREIIDFKYGAAAVSMMEYIEELARLRKTSLAMPGGLGADDTYEKVTFLDGEFLVKWQKKFDQMLEQVKNDPVRLRNVRIARLGIDIWSILFPQKIRSASPGFAYDGKKILARGLSACTEAEKAGMIGKDRNPARRVLETMSLYSNLKNDDIPSELGKYPREKISRYLPVPPPHFFANRASLKEDPDAIAGFAMSAVYPPEKANIRGINVEHYDAVAKKWLFSALIPLEKLSPEKYTLVRLGSSPISAATRLVLGSFWGSSLDMQDFSRYYDPSYQARIFEFWASLKFDGKRLSCDQVFVVNLGMPTESGKQ